MFAINETTCYGVDIGMYNKMTKKQKKQIKKQWKRYMKYLKSMRVKL